MELLFAFNLLRNTDKVPSLVARFVILGISLVGGRLKSLVDSVCRQIQNTFTNKECWKCSILVIVLGSINLY